MTASMMEKIKAQRPPPLQALVLGLLVALLARNADAQPEPNVTANYMVPMCHLDKHRIVGGTNYSLKCKPTQRMF